jgi:hypothetical protein
MVASAPSTSVRDVIVEMHGALCRASDLVVRRHRCGTDHPLATAMPSFDRMLGGGLPRGVLTELVGRTSCGRFATLMTVLQQITAVGEPAALVDQGGHLDPQAAAAAGIDLDRLLWVRPERLPDALAAAELLVATGFPLVAIDLGFPPVKGRASLAAWLRLARRTSEHRAVTLVGSPYRLSGCAAGMVVVANNLRGRWSGRAGELRTLEGLAASLELVKQRGRRSETISRLAFTLPEAAFGTTSGPFTEIPREDAPHVQAI